MSKSLKHLTVEAVKAIHREVLAAHGGAGGIRDETLLESAVAAPQASMMGQLLMSDPLEIAAAYLFYICRNHPFLDGNGRVVVRYSGTEALARVMIEADSQEKMNALTDSIAGAIKAALGV